MCEAFEYGRNSHVNHFAWIDGEKHWCLCGVYDAKHLPSSDGVISGFPDHFPISDCASPVTNICGKGFQPCVSRRQVQALVVDRFKPCLLHLLGISNYFSGFSYDAPVFESDFVRMPDCRNSRWNMLKLLSFWPFHFIQKGRSICFGVLPWSQGREPGTIQWVIFRF